VSRYSEYQERRDSDQVSFLAGLTPSEDCLDNPVERALHFLRAILRRRRRQHESGSEGRAVVRHGFRGYLVG